MPSKNVHDQCSCGAKKKIVSQYCRKCYFKSVVKYPCQKCGKTRKKTKSPICRDCYNKNRTDIILSVTTPIKDLFYAQGHRNKYNYIRAHARRIINSLKIKKECACCCFSKGVQICHIKPIASFPEDTALNIVNAVDNLILLCPNCHWLFDHGYSSLKELKKFYKYEHGESNPNLPSNN